MTVARAVWVGALVVSCTACTSFAETAECGAPELVVVSGSPDDPLGTEPAIELWAPDGGAEVLLDDPAASHPAMSPDGETVAVALGEGEWTATTRWPTSRVALVEVDSGEVTLLSEEAPGVQVAYLQWSTSGREIAFLHTGPDGRYIAAIDVETGEQRRVLPLPEGQGDFTWSPDGTEMLVPTRVPAGDTTVVELRRYFLGSGHHIVLTTVDTTIRQPSWSPDGRWVAMQTSLPGSTQLRQFVLDIETGERLPVDLRRGGPRSVAWSGPFLVYVYAVGTAPEFELMSWDSRTKRRSVVQREGVDRFVTGTISAPRCDSSSV